MPHIAVSLYPGRDEKTKLAMAEKVRDLFMKEFNFPEEALSVSMIEIAPEEFAERVNGMYEAKDILIKSKFVMGK